MLRSSETPGGGPGLCPGRQATCLVCLGASWPQYNEGFVSAVPAPTSPPSSCAPSSFLPGQGCWEGDSVCTWMDPVVSGEPRAGHSSGTEAEVAFPLLGWDLVGGLPCGRAEATQAQREPPLQDPTQKLVCSLQSSLLPFRAPERRQVAMVRVSPVPPACSQSPPALCPGSQSRLLGREGTREPLTAGAGLRVSFIISMPE